MVSTLRLKTRKNKIYLPPRYDTEKLRQQSNEKDDYVLECRNRFTVLEMLPDEDIEIDVNHHCKKVEEVFQESANITLGQRSEIRRKKWISSETWKLIEKRRIAKLNFESLREDSPYLALLRTEYWSLDSEVKRCSRRDKRRFIDSTAKTTEHNLNRRDGRSIRYAYEGIREITGKKRKRSELPVRSKNGNLLTKESEIKARWKEHFEETLNRPTQADEEDIPEAEHDLPIDVSDIRLAEVALPIRQPKNDKPLVYKVLHQRCRRLMRFEHLL